MNQIIRALFGITLSAFLCLSASCGGSGGSSGLQEPAADLSGTWDIDETVTGNCPDSTYPKYESYLATIVQTGNNLTVSYDTDDGPASLNGTISGNSIKFSGNQPSSSGTTKLSFSGSVSAEGQHFDGTASWSWTNGNSSCNGSAEISASIVDTSGGGGPALNTPYFQSTLLKVEIKPDGVTYVVTFTDDNGSLQSAEGQFNASQDVEVYNQNGYNVVLAQDNTVHFIHNYTDGNSDAVISTCIIYPDTWTRTFELRNGRWDYSSYRFDYYSDASGTLLFTGVFFEDTGILHIQYYDAADIPVDSRAVTVSYHPDSSQTLSFDNPFNNPVSLETPPFYPDIDTTISKLNDLEVYVKTDWTYLVVYDDGTTSHESTLAIGDSTTLPNGEVIEVAATGEVYFTSSDGNYIQIVDDEGITMEHDRTNNIIPYVIHFQTAEGIGAFKSGTLEMTYDNVNYTWSAVFKDLTNTIIESFQVTPQWNFNTDVYTFVVPYNNILGVGTLEFDTQGHQGEIISSMRY